MNAFTRSHRLADIIRHEIIHQHGVLSFSRFMELALYHPQYGYYSAETFSIGKTGDFTTAPEISPLFASCLARQSQQILESLENQYILELGAGSGKLAGQLLQALDEVHALPTYYDIYEISENLRNKQQQYLQTNYPHFFSRIRWLDQLPNEFSGLLIANEVLDALPIHCFHLEGKTITERCVGEDKNSFHFQLAPPTSPLFLREVKRLQQQYELPTLYESEIHLTLAPFIEKLATSLKKGVMLLIDYGYGEEEYYHPERNHGTLTTFYQHQKNHHPLILPGLQDITAHVNFTRVIEMAAQSGCELLGYTTQAAFLLATGLLEFAKKIEPTLTPADEFKLHQAIKTLTMPQEMGERIKVMALGKHFDANLLGFTFSDRRRDL